MRHRPIGNSVTRGNWRNPLLCGLASIAVLIFALSSVTGVAADGAPGAQVASSAPGVPPHATTVLTTEVPNVPCARQCGGGTKCYLAPTYSDCSGVDPAANGCGVGSYNGIEPVATIFNGFVNFYVGNKYSVPCESNWTVSWVEADNSNNNCGCTGPFQLDAYTFYGRSCGCSIASTDAKATVMTLGGEDQTKSVYSAMLFSPTKGAYPCVESSFGAGGIHTPCY